MNEMMQNKKISVGLATFLTIGLLSGCTNVNTEIKNESVTVEKKISYSNISPEEVRKRLDTEKGIVLLDVRTKEEFDDGHIKDAVHIPVDTIKEEAESKLKDKDSIIFVYCRSGNRSKTASSILVSLGYKNVYDLGGINKWPYEIAK
jgi:rhodanese-related sulfurtransferase